MNERAALTLTGGSAEASAILQLMSGVRTVSLNYEARVRPRTWLGTIVSRLVASPSRLVVISYPVGTRRTAQRVSRDLADDLEDYGLSFARTQTPKEVYLETDYFEQVGVRRSSQLVTINFPYPTLSGLRASAYHSDLLILDSLLSPELLEHPLGDLPVDQVLFVDGPRPQSSLFRDRHAITAPWGDVPLEVLLAGAPA